MYILVYRLKFSHHISNSKLEGGLYEDIGGLIKQSWVLSACVCHLLFTKSRGAIFESACVCHLLFTKSRGAIFDTPEQRFTPFTP